jgi:hypothetical protein
MFVLSCNPLPIIRGILSSLGIVEIYISEPFTAFQGYLYLLLLARSLRHESMSSTIGTEINSRPTKYVIG